MKFLPFLNDDYIKLNNMKKIILGLIFLISTNCIYAQNREEAKKLVAEGVTLHDKGEYDAAISKYDKALEADKDNFFALTEKSITLLSLQKHDDVIQLCQKIIQLYPSEKELSMVYVAYGNTYDALKNNEKALEVYNEGINKFPDFYLLHFNKGISYSGMKNTTKQFYVFKNQQVSILTMPVRTMHLQDC
jgi:tetratricopeptide (TPR) repeat protein